MTHTLTTEQLSQIKADIAARKAMPEFGESIEGNIERLRVIGATRSHFSTETVEMLVNALDELTANREAQPVFCVDMDSNFIKHIQKCSEEVAKWPEWKQRGSDVTQFAAPPAPAVPDERDAFESFVAQQFGGVVSRRRANNGDNEYMAWDMAMAWIVWQRRAAMLAQPVSQGNEWIACSERLPKVGGTVLISSDGYVSVGEMNRSGANYRYFTSVATGRELTVAHWMPLPAAPEGGN